MRDQKKRGLYIILIAVVVSLVLLAMGCGSSPDGVSSNADRPPEDLIAERGAHDTFGGIPWCEAEEVRDYRIVKWGDPRSEDHTTYFPVRVEVTAICKKWVWMSKNPGEKTRTFDYWFYRDEFGEWEWRKTSL